MLFFLLLFIIISLILSLTSPKTIVSIGDILTKHFIALIFKSMLKKSILSLKFTNESTRQTKRTP